MAKVSLVQIREKYKAIGRKGQQQMTEPIVPGVRGGGRSRGGPYGDHLRRIFVSLSQDTALCDVVRDVIAGRQASGDDSFYRLRSSGIVAGECAREMKLRRV